jgi:predicted DNA-binding transcriptional regulator AlpA
MDDTTYTSDRELAARYGVSRPTIWRWAADGRFPKPISLQPGTTRWRMSDVIAWEHSRTSTAQASRG